MSKYYSPRDYDCIGFGNNRRWIPKEEKKDKNKSKKTKHEHFKKHWDEDLWD